MKHISLLSFTLALSLLSLTANAFVMTNTGSSTNMTVDTRNITNAIDNTDFVTSWTNQSSAVNSTSLSVFDQYYAGNNSISRLTINFSTGGNGNWGIDAGVDAAYGAALYMDGVLIENRTQDLWWSYNWSNPAVLSANTAINTGAHTLDLYWAEACCNGYNSGRFTTDNGASWQALSVANIDRATAVPEPGTLALLGIGLIGLARARRIK